jgi:hypothetical protein
MLIGMLFSNRKYPRIVKKVPAPFLLPIIWHKRNGAGAFIYAFSSVRALPQTSDIYTIGLTM